MPSDLPQAKAFFLFILFGLPVNSCTPIVQAGVASYSLTHWATNLRPFGMRPEVPGKKSRWGWGQPKI